MRCGGSSGGRNRDGVAMSAAKKTPFRLVAWFIRWREPNGKLSDYYAGFQKGWHDDRADAKRMILDDARRAVREWREVFDAGLDGHPVVMRLLRRTK